MSAAVAAGDLPVTIDAAFDAIDQDDLGSAVAILESLAARGDARAQAALGVALDTRRPRSPGDVAAATELLEKAADKGVAAAALELGNRYYQGLGVARDPVAAAAAWRRAAVLGMAQAQYNLGVAYLTGAGVPVSAGSAKPWFERAAAAGNAEAQFALGVMLSDPADPDFAAARALFSRAAETGHGLAQHNLAFLYEHGMGGSPDLAAARQWYTAAADQDITMAAAALARLAPAKPSPPIARGEPAGGQVFDAAWVRRQNPDHYTIQIATAYDAGAIHASLVRHVPALDSAYFKSRNSPDAPYTAIAGSFETVEQARAVLRDLPARLKANEPWIRRFGTLHKRLDDTTGPIPAR